MDFSSAIESILSELKKVASSEAIVGKPIKTDQATVIPVSRLRLGFGVGVGDARSGEDRGAGSMGTGAGGGGVSVDPQAFVVVNADGRAHMISLKDTKDASLIQAISILPDVVEKVIRTGGDVFGGKKSDTGPSDTGPSDTGPSDTGPSDTGPSDTGPSDTGPGDAGPGESAGDAGPGESAGDAGPGESAGDAGKTA